MQIPGFRFLPTDQEVTEFLQRKVLRLPLPPSPITVRNLYGGDPWCVFKDDDPSWLTISSGMADDAKNSSWNTKDTILKKKKKTIKMIYAFVRVQNASHKRICRTAGCGTWRGGTGRKIIYNDQGQKIGFFKTFDFRVTKGPKFKMDGHWIMYEYSLDEVFLKSIPTDCSDKAYVLCKIIRDDSKPLKFQLRRVVEQTAQAHTDTTAIGCERLSTRHNLEEEDYPQDKEFWGGYSSIEKEASELGSLAKFDPAAGELHTTPDWDSEHPLTPEVLSPEGQELLRKLLQDDDLCTADMLQIQWPKSWSGQAEIDQVEQPLLQELLQDGDVGAADMLQDQSPKSWFGQAEIPIVEEPVYGINRLSAAANRLTAQAEIPHGEQPYYGSGGDSSEWTLEELFGAEQNSRVLRTPTDAAAEYGQPMMTAKPPLSIQADSDVPQNHPPASPQAEISRGQQLNCSCSLTNQQAFDWSWSTTAWTMGTSNQ